MTGSDWIDLQMKFVELLHKFNVEDSEERAWQKILEPCFSNKTYIQLLKERAEP